MTETTKRGVKQARTIQNLLVLLHERSDITLREMGDEIGKSPAWVSKKVHQARDDSDE